MSSSVVVVIKQPQSAESGEAAAPASSSTSQNRIVTKLKELCICCRNKHTELINFEKLRTIMERFHNDLARENKDFSLFNKSNGYSLTSWSKKVMMQLAEIDDEQVEFDHQNRVLSEHFNHLQNFYAAVHHCKVPFQTKKISLTPIIDSIQVYEQVISLAFVIIRDRPRTLEAINEQLLKMEEYMREKSSSSCGSMFSRCSFLCCTPCRVNKRLDEFMISIDQRLADFQLGQVASLISNLTEIFSAHAQVDLKPGERLFLVGQLIEKLVRKIAKKFEHYSYFYDYCSLRRDSKWSILNLTSLIKSSNGLGNRTNAVCRLIASFHTFYSSMDQLIQNYTAFLARMKKFHSSTLEINPEFFTERETQLEKLEAIGVYFQKIEVVIMMFILRMKDHEEILYPAAGHLDECARVMQNYCSLHLIFKIYHGRSYLSRVETLADQIVKLLITPEYGQALRFQTPEQMLVEFELAYPELINHLIATTESKKLDYDPEIYKSFEIHVREVVRQVLRGKEIKI